MTTKENIMTLRVRYMSDLHIEHSNCLIDSSDCDVLILAGDICAYINDFYIVINKIPTDLPTLLVLGNHEYEDQEYSLLVSKLKNIIAEYDCPNIHVLENNSIDIQGVRFLGTTLWTNYEGYARGHNLSENLANEAINSVKNWCKNHVFDYFRIYHRGKDGELHTRSIENSLDCFDAAYQFLQTELQKEPEIPKVVITHFAPLWNSNQKDLNESSYWTNHLPELMGKAKFWIHGHTHHTLNYNFDGTNILCNPRGYSKLYNLAENKKFDPKATFTI